MSDRTVNMRGNPLPLAGPQLYVGDPAPHFRLHQRAPEGLKDVTLDDFAGRTLIISVIFSIETPICQAQTRRFNEAILELPGDVDCLTVSMDLPYALSRFANEHSVHHLQTASDHRDGSFGRDYGVLIEPLRLLSRAVFVIAPNGVIKYAEYVPEVTQEPVYESAIATAREPND